MRTPKNNTTVRTGRPGTKPDARRSKLKQPNVGAIRRSATVDQDGQPGIPPRSDVNGHNNGPDTGALTLQHPAERLAYSENRNGQSRALATMPTLDEQADRATSTLATAKARSTLRAYRIGWRDFCSFYRAISAISTEQEDDVLLPVTPAAVVLYLNHLAHDRRASLPTITQRVAAIRHTHAAAGHPSPTLAAAVTETLHGIRRFYAELRASGDDSVTARQKGELRLSALERVIDTCGDDPGGIRDAAMFAVGFFGAFRRSELAALRLRDIDDNGDRMTITLTRSKTDQEGNGHVKAFVQRTDAAYCPVRLLRRWLSIRGTDDPTSFVFVNVHRKGAIGCRGLDGKDVARRLKLRAERAGIDVSRLGGHSLRIGFVTEARRRGAVTSEIQRQTGHRTERMITHYTRANDAFEMNAVTRF